MTMALLEIVWNYAYLPRSVQKIGLKVFQVEPRQDLGHLPPALSGSTKIELPFGLQKTSYLMTGSVLFRFFCQGLFWHKNRYLLCMAR